MLTTLLLLCACGFGLMVWRSGSRRPAPREAGPTERLDLRELLERPPSARGPFWASQLRRALPTGRFSVQEPMDAGTGGPCVRARLADGISGSPFAELVQRATDACAGVAVSAGDSVTTEVSFGALATMRMFGAWEAPGLWSGPEEPPGRSALEQTTPLQFGAPNEEYLPAFVRAALRQHIKRLGVDRPVVLLVYWPDRGRRDLVFNIHPEQFATSEDFTTAMCSLQWWIPAGYQVLGVEPFRTYLASSGVVL